VREVDPTGAGDIFAAVYFALCQATGDPFAAAEPAVALASASVERQNLASIPTPAEAQAVLRGRRLK
jgi:sugar/nucleoside kinase (ribokinase family)